VSGLITLLRRGIGRADVFQHCVPGTKYGMDADPHLECGLTPIAPPIVGGSSGG
jgi:hypothetical protein